MSIDLNTLEGRGRAGLTDRPIDHKSEHHGVGRGSEYIGGYSGIGWYEVYRDRNTGVLYKVHCFDGVNGGNSAHSREVEEHIEQLYAQIKERTKAAAADAAAAIVLSTGEWHIMLKRTFAYWLDNMPGEQYKTTGDGNRHLDEGQIGTINGIPVIVDPKREWTIPNYRHPEAEPASDFDHPSGGGMTFKLDLSGIKLS